MKKILLTLTALVAFTVNNVWAECKEPIEVDLPDGATATTEQMIEGQKGVKAYLADGDVFLSCMEKQAKKQSDDVTEEQKKADLDRYNAVVDKMQQMGASFNAQIKAYKAAQAK